MTDEKPKRLRRFEPAYLVKVGSPSRCVLEADVIGLETERDELRQQVAEKDAEIEQLQRELDRQAAERTKFSGLVEEYRAECERLRRSPEIDESRLEPIEGGFGYMGFRVLEVDGSEFAMVSVSYDHLSLRYRFGVAFRGSKDQPASAFSSTFDDAAFATLLAEALQRTVAATSPNPEDKG